MSDNPIVDIHIAHMLALGVKDISAELKKDKKNGYLLNHTNRKIIKQKISLLSNNETAIFLLDKTKDEYLITNKINHVICSRNSKTVLKKDLKVDFVLIGDQYIKSDFFSLNTPYLDKRINILSNIFLNTLLGRIDIFYQNNKSSLRFKKKSTEFYINKKENLYELSIRNYFYSLLSIDSKFENKEISISDAYLSKLNKTVNLSNPIFKGSELELLSYLKEISDLYRLQNDKSLVLPDKKNLTNHFQFIKDFSKNENQINDFFSKKIKTMSLLDNNNLFKQLNSSKHYTSFEKSKYQETFNDIKNKINYFDTSIYSPEKEQLNLYTELSLTCIQHLNGNGFINSNAFQKLVNEVYEANEKVKEIEKNFMKNTNLCLTKKVKILKA